MIFLTTNEIVELHKKVIASTGGSHGIRDFALLESAIQGCYQSFGGEDLYPGVINKAARMAFAICKNHPFVDGNKRVAITAMLVLLRMNGLTQRFDQHELISLGLGIADSTVNHESIIKWVNKDTVNDDNKLS